MTKICDDLHKTVRNGALFRFPYDPRAIPLNGIYILFEAEETGHRGNRIVRVGTHTGSNQLRSRLKQHFIQENKDRSIFRKNIGRALLYKRNDRFLEQWNWDLTTRKNKDKYGHLVDWNKKKRLEKEVSSVIQENFYFAVMEVEDKDTRMALESRIISTVSLCQDCKPSNGWLGNWSPKGKIRESGLWLVNQLYKEPLVPRDLETIGYSIAEFDWRI